MTVTGSLEDLSFPDILQVVHVSRQSGTLVLAGSEGERRVRFRNGLVCGATLGPAGPELEDLLVQKGLVAAAFLPPARARQALTGESLSSALVGLGAVSQETIDRLVRNELRSLLRSLVLLQDGEFRFELLTESPSKPETAISLQEGLRPESILEGLPPRDPGTRPAKRRGGAEAGPAGHVLLVTDRSSLRLALSDELRRSGLAVTACSDPATALDRARALIGGGVGFDLICELILPESTGVGWRGGLDLIRDLRALRPNLRALVLGEVRHPSASEAARAVGAAAYLALPELAAVGVGEVGGTIARFCAEVCRALRHPAGIRDAGPATPGNGSVRVSDPLSLLRGLIGEMHSDQRSEISLLVLRLAAEYFERGVLFTIADGAAHGVGAFGPERGELDPLGIEQRIRGAVLPLAGDSMLNRALEGRATVQGPVEETAGNEALIERLGPPRPAEAALMPLLSGDEVFGILYGDNAPSGRPTGDLKALEIFLSQAGIALQNALLRRRLEVLTGSGEPGAAPGGKRSA